MWIALLVIFLLILTLLIIAITISLKDNRGDYGDGGGRQVGGAGRKSIFTPQNERAGLYGEKLVNHHIRPLLREDEYLLANLLLPLKSGYKTEIDCVLISRKGIFCIETKSWVGHISGNDKDEYWLQEYDDPCMKNREHKNPVIQNEGHCAVLERILHHQYQVDNVVIFVSLEDGFGIDSKFSYTLREFKNYYRSLGDELTSSQINQAYKMLLPFVATPEEINKHKEEIARRFH